MLKDEALRPMPSASMSTATVVKPGDFRSERSAWRRGSMGGVWIVLVIAIFLFLGFGERMVGDLERERERERRTRTRPDYSARRADIRVILVARRGLAGWQASIVLVLSRSPSATSGMPERA
jgi:hypothetical protein